MDGNWLYNGDNLDILREYVKDEAVDLVYLDPPFNSNQDYHIGSAQNRGMRVSAGTTHGATQASFPHVHTAPAPTRTIIHQVFKDSWRWDQEAARAYQEIVEAGGRLSQAMQAFRQMLGANDMLAYLAMMAPRLVELRRVLKSTGSIFLHCDPTASHYLKLLLDAIFGPSCFRNEIVWERTTGRKAGNQFGRVHDVILFYSKTDATTWNPPATPQSEETVRGHDLLRDKTGNI